MLPSAGRACIGHTLLSHTASNCLCSLTCTHPYSSLTNPSRSQWGSCPHICAGWFVSCRPNIPPPQPQQPVSVIASVKEQQQAELTHQRSHFQWWGKSGLYTEILVFFPVMHHFFQDFLSTRLINQSHTGSCSSSYTVHGVLPPGRQLQQFVTESSNNYILLSDFVGNFSMQRWHHCMKILIVYLWF